MTVPLAYGIDFGTTNSLVSAAYPDRVDLLAAEESRELLPSIVYLHRDQMELAGEQAIQTYGAAAAYRTACSHCDLAWWDGKDYQSDCNFARKGGGCHNARLLAEIKSFLADSNRESTHSWGRDYSFARIASIIIGQLKRRADEITGSVTQKAVVGHPVAFAAAQGAQFKQRQRIAIERLKEATLLAGFSEVELLEEPAAAVSVEDSDGVVVAVDFGGGTFDIAVIEMRPDRGIVLAMQGVAVGGEDFDEELFRAKLWPFFELDSGRIPARLRGIVSRRSTAIRALTDPAVTADFAGASGGLRLLRDVLANGYAYWLFRAIEDAKIQLSEHDDASIKFDRPGVRIDIPVSRGEFEKLLSRDLDLVFQQIERALVQAHVDPVDVDLVVRTGGSSAIPAFVDRLEDLFGPGSVVERPPYSSIAMGLGLHARKVWS